MDEVSEIKSKIDIAEFIGQYVTLKKAGINLSANCPFHNEKTPSFMVSSERQTFRCFGCGEGGDVITFFQKIEGLTFPEALRILGERVGVQVSFQKDKDYSAKKATKEKIYDINLLCAKYFKIMLHKKEGETALKYLRDRGLSDEIIEKMKIGFAPANLGLQHLLEKKGYSFQDLSLAGHPERFKYRLMFPIFDSFSLVTGFSGRIVEESLPAGVSPHPKYLNTPETEVFHKSQAIYGINFAKESIRKNNRVVLVEGQMDVALSEEAGFDEVVASSGTALTEGHLKILSRLTPNIVLCFDEDEAGQKAANSAVELALDLGLSPRLTIIKDYKDVGELVKQDRSKLKDVIENALPPVEWLFKRAEHSGEWSVQEKKLLGKKALNYIARFSDEIEKAHYISYVSRKLSVPEITLEKVLGSLKVQPRAEKEVETKASDPTEDLFVSFLLNYYPKIKNTVLYDIEFTNIENGTIYKNLVECYNSGQLECVNKVKNRLSREDRERLDAVSLLWDAKFSENEEIALAEFQSIKSRLDQKHKEKVKNNFASLIAEAERSGDIEKVKSLMQQLQQEFKN